MRFSVGRMSSSVADTGLSWDQLRTLDRDAQPKAAELSKEMYIANDNENYLVRESLRRRLVSMLRDADGV